MLKASKKALANNITKQTEDEKVKADYIKDMEKSKDQQQLEAQRKKYMDFLTNTIKRQLKEQLTQGKKPSEFIQAMHDKLQAGIVLSENMTSAIDKCMAKDTEPKKPVDESKLPKITLKMRKWWIQEHKLDSRVISGIILKETEKAYLLKGHADMVEGTYCMRCGRELTEPASMIIGFGSECCEKLGIPYPVDILTAPEKTRKALRKKLEKKLHDQTFEAWVPKSQVQEVLASSIPCSSLVYKGGSRE